MVCFCTALCCICFTYLYTCKDWHRRSKLQSCNRYKNSSCCNNGMGYGIYNPRTKRSARNQQKELDVSDIIGHCNGRFMAVLLQGSEEGEASKVVPVDKLSVVITLILAFVFLHEQFTLKSIIGCILIGIGTLLMVI